jgi:hypothetical protein
MIREKTPYISPVRILPGKFQRILSGGRRCGPREDMRPSDETYNVCNQKKRGSVTMKKTAIFCLVIALILLSALFLKQLPEGKVAREAIIYFPESENYYFLDAKTDLVPGGKGVFFLRTFSRLNEKAYLRQDISLVFADGRLILTQNRWKRDAERMETEQDVHAPGAENLSALSLHYAEIHDPGGEIKSAFAMSADRFPAGGNEMEKAIEKEERELERILQRAKKELRIPIENYDAFPLDKLSGFGNKPFPGFSLAETRKITGQLWEGIYKNYFLGIKDEKGRPESPLGSTMPIVLLAKDKGHLLVLFETKGGKLRMLKQMI